MKRLVACRDCGQMISKAAEVCPHCGAKPRRTPVGALILGGIVALAVVLWYWA